MKKLQILILIFCCFFSDLAAQTLVSTDHNSSKRPIRFASYRDYYPFFKVENNFYYTVFEPVLEKFSQDYDKKVELYVDNKGTYEDEIFSIRRGKVDMLVGMYNDTKLYAGLEYIYPAVIDNPLHILMAADKIKNIHSTEDLKNLKGVYNKSEYFSDYVLKRFEEIGLEAVSSSEEAYEQIVTGQKDYLIGSYFYNYGEIIRLGLKRYLSLSKTALWNMPVFLGLSKSSPNHTEISKQLNAMMLKNNFQDVLNEKLKEMMRQYELKYQGTVPPKFVRHETDNNQPSVQ